MKDNLKMIKQMEKEFYSLKTVISFMELGKITFKLKEPTIIQTENGSNKILLITIKIAITIIRIRSNEVLLIVIIKIPKFYKMVILSMPNRVCNK
jgi:hypothetical protein